MADAVVTALLEEWPRLPREGDQPLLPAELVRAAGRRLVDVLPRPRRVCRTRRCRASERDRNAYSPWLSDPE